MSDRHGQHLFQHDFGVACLRRFGLGERLEKTVQAAHRELSLTTPLFPRAEVRLGSGHKLRIDAEGTGTLPYVKALKVDGKQTTKAWLPAGMATKGGHLSYTLSSKPSLTWGSGRGDVAPQN